MSHAIRVRDLSKRFGSTQALDRVSFDVPNRSIFGLLGPNGAGKTTLFSITANFLRADQGSVEVLETDTRRISRLQGRLTILPQDARFQTNVPILDQLAFFRCLNGRSRAEAEKEVMRSLALVGLESVAKGRVGALSHGMLKRLGIAQAFLGEPEVILLDEPTAGLDPANARQIRDLVTELKKQATIVISSHNLGEIQEVCDGVAILDHGRLVLDGDVGEITRAGREYNLQLSRGLSEKELADLKAIAGVGALRPVTEPAAGGPVDYKLTLDLSNADLDQVLSAMLRKLLEMKAIPRAMVAGRSLEKQFLEVTGGQG